jgi:NAD(P)-dependent dehydrogenase (short-subunit alcohol dehydrogenase family)
MDKPVILITGALTGIGRATAVAFALCRWAVSASRMTWPAPSSSSRRTPPPS